MTVTTPQIKLAILLLIALSIIIIVVAKRDGIISRFATLYAQCLCLPTRVREAGTQDVNVSAVKVAIPAADWDTLILSAHPHNVGSKKIDQLWASTIRPYLHSSLWTDANAEDAGLELIVPLHAAFLLNEEAWQQDFSQHFHRFMLTDRTSFADGRLNQLQYLYLASRFIVLAAESTHLQLIPSGLVDLLNARVNNLWEVEPAWQWEQKDFSGGIKERVAWKLSHKAVSPSYYRAITDEELYLFAIGADLRTYEHLTGENSSISDSLTDILNVTGRIFREEIKQTENGGWLFQPGVWSEHPDYAYVNRQSKKGGICPAPIADIAWDTSHSTRFPLFLTSFANAYTKDAPETAYYEKLKRGLEVQLLEHVLIPPTSDFPNYRTTNFMDGRNGIYRWEYPTQGKSNGYGQYELSGTFLIGWWSFLDSDRIRAIYADISNRFPLSLQMIDLYVGPNTSRNRHALVRWPECYTNGFRELTVRLSSYIKFHKKELLKSKGFSPV